MIIIILIICIATIVINIIIIWKSHRTYHCGNEVVFTSTLRRLFIDQIPRNLWKSQKLCGKVNIRRNQKSVNSFLQYSRSINLKYFEHSWESQTTHSSKYQINFPTQCYLKELNQFCVPMDVCPLCP